MMDVSMCQLIVMLKGNGFKGKGNGDGDKEMRSTRTRRNQNNEGISGILTGWYWFCDGGLGVNLGRRVLN